MSPSAPWRVYSGSHPPPEGSPASHVLLHAHRPRWLVLNDTGLEIARLLAGHLSVEAAAARLGDSYGIPAERARADVAAVLERLTREGFLGPGAREPHPVRAPRIDSLYLHLTTRCNLDCPHCYVHSPVGRAAAPTELPERDAIRLVDELADLGGRSITFSGGEALLHPGARRILRRAAARGLRTGLLTNGTLLDERWAALLADLGVEVQVSLDGSRPEIHDAVRGRGSFERAVRAVERLQAAGLAAGVSLCATVMRANVGDLHGIIRLGETLGVPLVRFLPLRRQGMARDAWERIATGFGVGEQERFYREVAELEAGGGTATSVSCGLSGLLLALPPSAREDGTWCFVGRKLDVDADGDAYACVLLREERFRIGNVLREGLEELATSPAMRQACRDLCARRTAVERCADCLWQNLCQGGCMGQALDNAGTIWGVDDFCRYRQQAYREAFDRVLALGDADRR